MGISDRAKSVIFVITGGTASPARGRVHSYHVLTWGTMCPFLTRPVGFIFSSELWGKVMTLSLRQNFSPRPKKMLGKLLNFSESELFFYINTE